MPTTGSPFSSLTVILTSVWFAASAGRSDAKAMTRARAGRVRIALGRRNGSWLRPGTRVVIGVPP